MRFFRRFSLLALLGGVWYWRFVYRFRDPVRLPPQADPDAILSPADGRVSFALPIEDGQVMGLDVADLLGASQRDGWLLGMMMGPLDVHFAYAPVGGQVVSAGQKAGTAVSLVQALPFWTGATTKPERRVLEQAQRYAATLQTANGTRVSLGLLALAGPLGAMTYLTEGAEVQRAHKAAFLAEGGLVLLTLPAHLTPQVGVGERVRGAETVIAR